jgi:hypothetical protein
MLRKYLKIGHDNFHTFFTTTFTTILLFLKNKEVLSNKPRNEQINLTALRMVHFM